MTLSWLSIVRLGLVQVALGSVVVLTTSTLNRLMVVELALPALLPGFLVALHYGVQISRPNWGFLSDTSGRRSRWIIGGMVILAMGAMLASLAISVFAMSFALGLAVSILAYAMIGLGVGASGTSLLALLATATAERRRAAAAMITWLMMIAGIAVTAGVVGALLDPYSLGLLLRIVAVVCLGAVVLTTLAVIGIEPRGGFVKDDATINQSFRDGLREVWAEDKARQFTLFVALSMTAYFMQELILEPYAGLVFGFTPGQSTSLSGIQNGGVFAGMLVVGIAATGLRLFSLRTWVIAGCVGSALSLSAIAMAGATADPAVLRSCVIMLGVFNGMFAVAAIGSMMALAAQGRAAREGTRMGLWGAAQALAAGFGGLLGAASADLMRYLIGADAPAFSAVFLAEALLFLMAAIMAYRVIAGGRPRTRSSPLMTKEATHV
ncbi:MAG: BCD family MFS transporter [Arenibacterium sp.]